LRRVVETLITHGHVRRGFLGIGTIPVRLPAALEKAVGQRAGLLVTSVAGDSGAARAGLLLGDVIVAVEGKGVSGPGDLLPFLEEDRIGQSLAARILRAEEPRDVAITIGAREPKGGRA
ncbi:MAG TPA: PDZ domain-containing protein, partial [Vicinamibacteria bacterium]|nr:PDZ domain-containing protein [Vicinamibacteria bacterium]